MNKIKCDSCGLSLKGHTNIDCIRELVIQIKYGNPHGNMIDERFPINQSKQR